MAPYPTMYGSIAVTIDAATMSRSAPTADPIRSCAAVGHRAVVRLHALRQARRQGAADVFDSPHWVRIRLSSGTLVPINTRQVEATMQAMSVIRRPLYDDAGSVAFHYEDGASPPGRAEVRPRGSSRVLAASISSWVARPLRLRAIFFNRAARWWDYRVLARGLCILWRALGTVSGEHLQRPLCMPRVALLKSHLCRSKCLVQNFRQTQVCRTFVRL